MIEKILDQDHTNIIAQQQRREEPLEDRIGTKSSGIAPDDSVTDDTFTDDTIRDNTIRDNTVRDNTVRDNTVRDNTVRDNTVADNTVADNSVADDTVADATTFTNDDGEIVKITSVQDGVMFKAVDENGEQIYQVVKNDTSN